MHKKKNVIFFLIALIFSLKSFSQCIVTCNQNVGVFSNNNAASIAYDNMISSFHSSVVAEEFGYKVWGENVMANGTTHSLFPRFIDTINFPTLKGKVLLASIGSNSITNAQLVVLTSDGLFVGGIVGAVISIGIKSNTAFNKITVNGKTDGLPFGISPDSVKMLFVSHGTILITTCGGRVFSLSQFSHMRGDNLIGNENQWSQVFQSNGQPLTNVIAARGNTYFGYALKNDNTIWTWGWQTRLGDGTLALDRARATQMVLPAGVTAVKMIQATSQIISGSVSNATTYYLLDNQNRLFGLGRNNVGQVGDHTNTDRNVWVRVKQNATTDLNNTAWISANEHDPIFANLAILSTNSQARTVGSNSRFMIARNLNNGINHTGFPNGIASSDTILFCEVGGHTSAFVKINTPRYGYTGHHVNGSIGNNSGLDNEITSVNFVIPPVISICGTVCDTPKLYKLPFNCGDSIAKFVIKGRSNNLVKFKINGVNDSIIIPTSDSVIIQLINPASDVSLQILSVNNVFCNISLNIRDTVKLSSRLDTTVILCKGFPFIFNNISHTLSGNYNYKLINYLGCDSFISLNLIYKDTSSIQIFDTICRGGSVFFNNQNLTNSGIYKDTLTNRLGCDSFIYFRLIANDTSRKDTTRTICKNQSVFFNNQIINSAGIFKDTLVNSKGCDSFVYLTIIVNDTISNIIFDTICSNQIYLMGGQMISVSGIYKDTLKRSSGCDSFVTLHLFVKDTTKKDSFLITCKNQPIVFNGISRNSTGIYRDTLVNSKGCDSFLYLYLTIKDTTKKDSFLTICKNQPIIFNGISRNISGIYKDTLVNTQNCDSFLYLHLTVNDTIRTILFDTICQNQTKVFGSTILQLAGTYFDTLSRASGCDSFVTLHLFVKDTTKKDSFLAICKNQPIVFNGMSRNNTGIYRDTLINAQGCDSFIYLHLTVKDTTKIDSFLTICKNQPIVFNGISRNSTGVYRDTLVNSKGCDSFLYLYLTVKDTTKKDSFRIICKNQFVVFNGQTLNTTGIYKDTLVNSQSCDSFMYLHLTVNDTIRTILFDTICQNQTKVFGSTVLQLAGTYFDTLSRASGCDSFVILHLFVKDTTKKDSFLAICKNQPIVFNGMSRNNTGIYRDTLINAKGCDSFVTLHLFVKDTTKKDSFITICKNQPIVFNGMSRNVNGVYKDTLVNSLGCDSFVYLHLTVKDTTKKDSFLTICKNQSIIFNGISRNISGIYKDTLMNSQNCDSFLYLHLTVNDTTTNQIFQTICVNNPIFFNGILRNTSGLYKDTLFNSKGCDSFVYLNLTVNDTTKKDSFLITCKNQPIIFNGISRNNTGIYRDTLINAKGCDSFLYLHLTVNDTTKKDSFLIICKNQPVVFNGMSRNISGIYKDTLVNSLGCDSFIYLHLTVNDTTKKDSFRIICKNQFVVFNGQTLSITGIYKDTLVNAKGCDSFIYLHLTVNDTTTNQIFQTICVNNPILFNGILRNISGLYKDTLVNSKGCDSFVYLNLTVNDTTKKDSFLIICKNQPVIFNGMSRNTSGVYRDTLLNSKGCDSFLYLHLTVKDTTKFDTSILICNNDSIFFNNKWLTKSGVYKDTLINTNGCDSFIYLSFTSIPLEYTFFDTICEYQFSDGYNKTGIYRDSFSNSNIFGCDSVRILNLEVENVKSFNLKQRICEGDTFEGYFLPNTYIDTLPANAVERCYQIRTIELEVIERKIIDSSIICQGEKYRGFYSNNKIDSISGMKIPHLDTIIDIEGCTRFIELYLKVLDTGYKYKRIDLCDGDSYLGIKESKVFRDTLVANNGCPFYDVLEIVKEPKIEINLNDTSICEDKFNLPIRMGTDRVFKFYTWNTGETTPFINVSKPGLYYLKVMNQNGCIGYDSMYVNSLENPFYEKEIQFDEVEERYEILIETDTFLNQIFWKTSNLILCQTCFYQEIKFKNQDSIWLYFEIENEFNCKIYDSIQILKIDSLSGFISFPSAFSPNGDFRNDKFGPIAKNVKQIKWTIFNRWGEVVFLSESETNWWDGRFKNEACMNNLYIWTCEVTFNNGKTEKLKGEVYLMR